MARSKNLGLSLVEIVVVVTIILIVVAISYPVFLRAKEKTGEVVTKSNLHQLWIAMDIYRTEHDGQGYYGHHAHMGLPNWFDVNPHEAFRTQDDVWRSGCQFHRDNGFLPKDAGQRGWILYNVYDDEHSNKLNFEEYARKFEEDLVVFQDLNCNDASVRLMDRATRKRAIGVTLGGNIVSKIASGDPRFLDWWE